MDDECELIVERMTPDVLERELIALESKYGMPSEQFLVRYTCGELGDDLDFIRWSGLLRTASQTGIDRRSHANR